jgi:hypothetical protein
MRRLVAFRCLALLAVLLAACQSVQTPPATPAAVADDEPAFKVSAVRSVGELDRLLLYFDSIKRLAGRDLTRELGSARQAYDENKSDYNRARFALLLSMPGASFRDEAKAIELLEPLVKDARAEQSPLRGLANLVYQLIAEQRRQERNARGLQEKLDALRTLERSLNERERGAAPVRK